MFNTCNCFVINFFFLKFHIKFCVNEFCAMQDVSILSSADPEGGGGAGGLDPT